MTLWMSLVSDGSKTKSELKWSQLKVNDDTEINERVARAAQDATEDAIRNFADRIDTAIANEIHRLGEEMARMETATNPSETRDLTALELMNRLGFRQGQREQGKDMLLRLFVLQQSVDEICDEFTS